jgi:LacI family transcriptional regulator
VTLHDVASEADVHFTIVSKVLNGGRANIRPETRRRIEETAARLGYRPNAVARGLRTSSTGAIGLLLPSVRNPVYSAIVRGAFERAWERGFIVVYAEDAGGADAARAYERLVEQSRIDGLLVATARPDNPLLDLADEARVPCVFVNRRHPSGKHSVSMREEDAGALAAQHLLGLGHTRLGHVAGLLELDTARRRFEGFKAEAARHDVRVAVEPAAFDEQGGYDAMARLLTGKRPPTGVFVSNINQSVGALAAARDASFPVPERLSVIGYDDDPLGEFLDPPLTAIAMPLRELGGTAVDVLLDRIERGEDRDAVIPTAPQLVTRRSTAPPPQA